MATWQPGTPQKDRSGWAVAALVLGIVNLGAWFLPICGGPLALVGIIVGVLGLRSSRRVLAIVGIVLSVLGLVLAVGNAMLGVFLSLKKQEPAAHRQPTPQVQRAPEYLTPQAQQAPMQPTPQAQRPVSGQGTALDVRYDTSPATPVKGQPFRLTLKVANLMGAPYRVCAVNFRGSITSIYEGLVSPLGQDYWVDGGAQFEEGAILSPCVTVSPGTSQTFVFGMKSYVGGTTWNGQVGFCSGTPSEDNPDAVLDKCFYLPVSITVR